LYASDHTDAEQAVNARFGREYRDCTGNGHISAHVRWWIR